MKRGLYIVKYYLKNTRTGELSVMLKYGRTSNIETRMNYYRKKRSTSLLAFFPCSNEKERESYFKEWSSCSFIYDLRYHLSESVEFNTNVFKNMYSDLFEISKYTKKELGL